MLHASETELRRLQDEPFAIPDRVTDHVFGCRSCRSRYETFAREAESCSVLLDDTHLVPNLDEAWARMEQALGAPKKASSKRADVAVMSRSRIHLGRLTLRSGLVAGAVILVPAAAATAATFTSVFAPTHVAPLTLNTSDVSALANFMGLGQLTSSTSIKRSSSSSIGTQSNASTPQIGLGGFPATSGKTTTSFGSVQWSSSSKAHSVATLAEADAAAGFSVSIPRTLPRGVSGPDHFLVAPSVEVAFTFNKGIPNVGGSTVQLNAGPAVLVEYGSSGVQHIPTLEILAMKRPAATSTGASTSQIEAFLLEQPDLPPNLVQEVRFLGNLSTTLPVPVPPGATERSVDVNGAPGVLVGDPSNAASGVVWEDSAGMLHAIAGLIDQKDALNVANQVS